MAKSKHQGLKGVSKLSEYLFSEKKLSRRSGKTRVGQRHDEGTAAVKSLEVDFYYLEDIIC